ncbi:uncharacterized protein LOC118189939 isoform X1 [Stegodyphus dumicola]|uniref:uncharacterized protein LOC118189939 isoform X1 n=1 Tax=Stegodyphus dumicola TaxID=202533 RepID=UPI0015AC5A8F|nr:uncharacterized protein LOC118189939 isoform X1 [Stegodyphus dumicola]
MEKSEQILSSSFNALTLLGWDDSPLSLFVIAQALKLDCSVTLMKALIKEFKTVTDRNGIDFDIFHLQLTLKRIEAKFLKDVPFFLSIERDHAYFREKLLTIVKGSMFRDYIANLKRRLDTCNSVEEVENWLQKFVKVCCIIPRLSETPTVLRVCRFLFRSTEKDVELYKFIAELLEFCYNVDIQDSPLVTSLLVLTINWYILDIADVGHFPQPLYRSGFLGFLLKHTINAKFDLISYCSEFPRSLWNYSRSFSVFDAVSCGNEEQTLMLLQHGMEVFTAKDLMKSGHVFQHIPQVIPPRHLLILQMMRMMRSINMFILNAVRSADFGLYSATQDQKRSFELVWRAIPDPHIKYKEIAVDILKEYCFLERHYVTNPMRYEKNWKYLLMYENCFKDVATSPKEPRTLKHLCRCTIRKSLKDAWKLPVGIFQLRLPKILQDYLNLEFD